jgi:hypothetical protein
MAFPDKSDLPPVVDPIKLLIQEMMNDLADMGLVEIGVSETGEAMYQATELAHNSTQRDLERIINKAYGLS